MCTIHIQEQGKNDQKKGESDKFFMRFLFLFLFIIIILIGQENNHKKNKNKASPVCEVPLQFFFPGFYLFIIFFFFSL